MKSILFMNSEIALDIMLFEIPREILDLKEKQRKIGKMFMS
jgi:hypothetical protein